jgi:hypothetical protein
LQRTLLWRVQAGVVAQMVLLLDRQAQAVGLVVLELEL